MKKLFFTIFAVVFFAFAVSGEAAAQDYKIKQSVSMSGQKSTTTIYVKGQRKRTETGAMMGMGGGVASIDQCDLKQNVKVSDKIKKYYIEPFNTGSGDAKTAEASAKAKTPSKRGGTLTLNSNIIDTGERKQMFGLTARHVKSSVKMESSADACSPTNMSIESDGWYVDLPSFSCAVNIKDSMPQYEAPRGGGCRDQIVTRNTGSGKLGFALSETRTMGMEGQTIAQSTETLEFTTSPVLASLFEIPSGYSSVPTPGDLYGAPDMVAMMAAVKEQSGNDSEETAKLSKNNAAFTSAKPAAASGAKRPGIIRIGVMAPTNRGENVSITNLQAFLAQKLTAGNTEGVSIGSEADARAAECDYILSSDLSKLKQSTASKIGGLFGKVTNTNTSTSGTYEAQVDFKLVKLADGKSVLQNKASNKGDGGADRAAESVFAMTAAAVLDVVR